MKNIFNKITGNVIENKIKYGIVFFAIVAVIIAFFVGSTLAKHPEYTITFNTNGGEIIEDIKVKKNETITKPTDPIREGYKFLGWYYNDELYDFSTPVTKDMELEARWQGNGKVSGVSLSDNKLELNVGDTHKLIVTVKPDNAEDKAVTWKSSNTSVASVDENGNVKALKVGTATITVTTKDGNYSATATITVKAKPVNVTGIVLNKTSANLTEGDSLKLIATVKPDNATNKTVTWKSSNTSVASVDAAGNVRALKAGTAIITATTKDGNYSATATITVKAKPIVKATGIVLNKTSANLTEGDSLKLIATVKPDNATNKTVTWKSSNTSVASVDTNGNVRALKAGTAIITVTTKDGNYSATATITVIEKPASYTITFTPIIQDVTNAVMQYSMTIAKNSNSFSNYQFVIYNNTKIVNNSYLATAKYNKNITTAMIKLNDGTEVTANVVYR